jgi:hypothetical protein
MNEPLTSASDKPSSPPEPAKRLSSRRRIVLGALLALAGAGGLTLWVFVGRNNSRTTVRVVPVKPVALSASVLRTLSAVVPKVSYQVEVFDSSAAGALGLATSGQVRPA